MMRPVALLAATALIGSVALAAEAPPNEVLLLGLRKADGSLAMVTADASGLRAVAQPGLRVPKPPGGWRLVEMLDRKQDELQEKAVWIRDATSKAAPPKLVSASEPDDNAKCHSEVKEELLFVGSGYYSVERYTSGFCEGMAHPWETTNLITLPNSETNREKPASMKAVLGKAAAAAWKKAATGAHGGARKREKDCLGDASENDWALVRQRGHWTLRAELNYAYEACRGHQEYFSIPTALPTSVTGADALPRSWESYKKATPGLLDVVVSPSGKLTLLVTAAGLELRSADKSIATLPEKGASIVMTRWGVGDVATKWLSELK